MSERKRWRVLIGDDTVDSSRLVARQLRRTGLPLDIFYARDGLETLKVARAERVDCAIVDLFMPQMTGLQVARVLRSERGSSGLSLVACTADDDPEIERTCIEAGFDEFLTKPFCLSDLRKSVLPWHDERHLKNDANENNAEHALDHVDSDIADLLPGFLENRRSDRIELQRCVERRDFATARRLGHGMKGSGGSYGFSPITEIGAIIEEAAQRQDAEGLDAAVRRLDHYLGHLASTATV